LAQAPAGSFADHLGGVSEGGDLGGDGAFVVEGAEAHLGPVADGGDGVKHPRMPGTDTDAYERGFVSLTPLRMDLYEPTGNEAASMIAGVRR
jgi:hypothetical protein